MIAKNVTFGVEIECMIPVRYMDQFTVGGYHRGIQIPGAPTGWNMQRDGSIREENGFFPCEIVSPVLKGERGLVEVVYILDQLKYVLGAKVNTSCGLHIHIGKNRVDVDKVVNFFRRVEKDLFRLNGRDAEGRYLSHYCQPLMGRDAGTTRYQSLNITNPNTVEFRLFAGTLDAERVVANLYLCVGLVIVSQTAVGDADLTVKDLAHLFCDDAKTYRIVPECTVWDVMKPAFKQVKAATL
jgi:hypothetical protein